MANSTNPKIVSRQESGPTVRQPRPSGDAYPLGFGLFGAQRMLVDPALVDLAKKVMNTMPGDVVPIKNIEASLLKTGGAFMVHPGSAQGRFPSHGAQ